MPDSNVNLSDVYILSGLVQFRYFGAWYEYPSPNNITLCFKIT